MPQPKRPSKLNEGQMFQPVSAGLLGSLFFHQVGKAVLLLDAGTKAQVAPKPCEQIRPTEG